MIKKLLIFIKNLKIKYKLLLGMITITTVSLLFISLLSYNYFSSVYERDTKNNAQYTLDITSTAFRNRIDSILKNTSMFLSSTAVSTALTDIYINNTKDYISNYGNIQDDLGKLTQSEEFIDTVLMVGKNGEFFALTKYGLNHDASSYFDLDFKNTNGISFLPIRKNPISYSKDVIPITLPISQLNVGNFIFSGTVEDSVASIFILLDANRVSDYLKALNKNANSTLYVAKEDGEPLNLYKGSDMYNIAVNPNIIDHINSTSPSTEFDKSINNETFLIASEIVGICNLKIVSVVSKNVLLSGFNAIKAFILAEWGITFILTVLMSLMLSQFITKPIMLLMDIVKKIENGTYTVKRKNKYKDEIGVLFRSINSMYDTIQLQIELIKQEEQEKSKSEIKVLAEQINPHFIYNTLECIHLEILSKNTEDAADMIESLGDFLRIALNYGDSIISMQQELKHVTEYINIMNHRSNQRIAFRYTLDDRLKHYDIVKLILQPLAENSIKHGFANDITNGIILSPYIEINISLKENNRISIEVCDNGRGIDIDKATNSLYQISTENKSHHVGLHNIYKRLRLYYGNTTSISFNTTPYYRNSVIIEIPYMLHI
jgi:two-component system sensor histidine kinase YesM